MARRYSAPEAELRRSLVSQRLFDSGEIMDSTGDLLSASCRELPAPKPVPIPAPRMLEIVVSQGGRTRATRPTPRRHRPTLTTDIDEYVSEILVESLHSLGDRLESVSFALGGSVSVLEKEIKVRLQNTGENTVVYLNPTSKSQIIFGSDGPTSIRESEWEHERSSSLNHLNHIFEENRGAGDDSRAASPAASLVDSLDEPVLAAYTPPTTELLTLELSTHTDKSEAFFIRIDDGPCDRDKDKVVVADHMPEKIRRSLNRRQRRRKMRIERSRKMRSRGDRESRLARMATSSGSADGQEARKECAAVLQALVEAVAEMAARAGEPQGRRRSRIPVRVAERRWGRNYTAPDERVSRPAPSATRPRPRPPHVALLHTPPPPLASCS